MLLLSLTNNWSEVCLLYNEFQPAEMKKVSQKTDSKATFKSSAVKISIKLVNKLIYEYIKQ